MAVSVAALAAAQEIGAARGLAMVATAALAAGLVLRQAVQTPIAANEPASG